MAVPCRCGWASPSPASCCRLPSCHCWPPFSGTTTSARWLRPGACSFSHLFPLRSAPARRWGAGGRGLFLRICPFCSFFFFIFIVSNAGGSLTPLGDPPLFLGFLKGVDFFWTVRHIFPETLFLLGVLLALFYVLDSWFYRHREEVLPRDPTPDTRAIGFDGKFNFALLGVVVALVLLSGFWKSSVVFNIAGTDVGLPGIIRDVGLIIVTGVSLWLTPKAVHDSNQ